MVAGRAAVLLALACPASVHALTLRLAYVGGGGRNEWYEGFRGVFLPRVQALNASFDVEAVDYIINDATSNPNSTAEVFAAVGAAAQGKALNGTDVGPIDVIIAGTSTVNVNLMIAAERYGIPNIHCSGGNPAFWVTSRPHAFGVHVPFTWYSQGPLAAGIVKGLRTVAILRSAGWQFTATSAIAALEWSRASDYHIVGPTLQWCNLYQNLTRTCRVVNSTSGQQRCVCGLQSEVDALGFASLKIEKITSMYEMDELKVAEPGFAMRSPTISPNVARFTQGIIDDIRSQGVDPDVVVSWVEPARSVFYTAFRNDLRPKMWIGLPQDGSTAYTGVAATMPDGSPALNNTHGLYTIGGGQWHDQLRTTDPVFNSNAEYVAAFRSLYGRTPTYDAAGCTTAGIVFYLAATKYAGFLDSSDVLQRREALRQGIGNVNDNTLFGTTRFNRMGQNSGRGAVAWQFLPSPPGSNTTGALSVVLPEEIAVVSLSVPMPTWDSKFGCPPGAFNTGAACLGCLPGTYSPTKTAGLVATSCSQCPTGLGTSARTVGAASCDACPAGYVQDGNLHRGICTGCPKGTFRNTSMPGSECSLCPRGTFADEAGSSACTSCPEGTFQSDRGQVACFCQVGWYRNPDPASTRERPCLSCNSIIAGSTTVNSASVLAEECTCAAGSYLSGAACRQCADDFPDGSVVCAGLGAPPVLVSGWMTLPNQSIVYKCAQNGDACPGGVPVGVMECSEGGTDIACGWCVDGYRYDAKSGMCTVCSPQNNLLWVCFAVAGAFVAFSLRPATVGYGEDTLIACVRATFISLSWSQVVDMLQLCAIWSGSTIQWSGLTSKILFGIGGLFAFNTLSPECDIKGPREDHALRIVILANLLPAFFICFVLLVSLPDALFPSIRRFRPPSRIDAVNSILGTIVSFFTTVLNLAVNLVFSMYPHPKIHERSLRVFPYILESSSEMSALRAVAGCSLAVWCVGSFVVLTLLSAYLQTHRPSLFLRRCTVTLVVRYRDGCNWWLIVEMLLKFMVAISVALFERPDIQMQWMTLVFLVYFGLVIQFKPYRFLRHTLAEALFTFGKILVLVLVVTSVYRGGPAESGIFEVLVVIFGLSLFYMLWCLYTFAMGRATEPTTDYENLALVMCYLGFHRDPCSLADIVPGSQEVRARLGLSPSEMQTVALQRASGSLSNPSLRTSGTSGQFTEAARTSGLFTEAARTSEPLTEAEAATVSVPLTEAGLKLGSCSPTSKPAVEEDFSDPIQEV